MSDDNITVLSLEGIPREQRVARHLDTVVRQRRAGDTLALVQVETVAEARAWAAALAGRGVPVRLSLPDEDPAAFERALRVPGDLVVHVYVECAS